MAKASNIIKVQIDDEDQEDVAIPTPVISGKVKKAPTMKAKEQLKVKKGICLKSNKKAAKKKQVIEPPIFNEGEKDRDLSVQSVQTKAISPVKKIIIESGQPGRDRSSILREIENVIKNESLNQAVQAVSKYENPQTATSTKDIIATSTKETQAKESDSQLNNKIKSKRSITLYKKIALIFIFLTIALLAVVAYFSFVKATIILIPNQERMSNNMIIDIYDQDKNSAAAAVSVKGAVALVEMSESGVYTASGTEVIGEEAIGQVTIINNYTKNQPLVASTRLLTPDGNKLYRLKDTVNVPAGGTIKVDIYADEPTPESAIGPTKFTIPGLWAGLQDKIYAENDKPVVYQQKLKRKITAADIDTAKQDLRQRLLARAKGEINNTYRDYSKIIYKLDEDSVVNTIDGQIGDEKENFTASMEANIIAVAFSGEEVAKLAKEKFITSLPENKELISFDESNMIYSLNDYNYANGVATINVTFEGKISLKENSDIIDKSKILGLSGKELDAYLAALPDIAGFEVVYYPSFIKRVPNLVDRINVEIKK